jgi:hypothetical protein
MAMGGLVLNISIKRCVKVCFWLFQHPLLVLGGDEFVYESCTGLSAKSGSLVGDFTFVPGRWVV